MPDYKNIYNHVVSSDPRYNLAENSPGLRAVTQATDELSLLSGRSLDLGCGVGFVVEYLSGPTFDFNAFGVDISDMAIHRANTRLESIPGIRSRLSILENQTLPFEDNYFSLVTCFDVLEHLDPGDIETTLSEINRILQIGGVFFGSVSCRLSGAEDKNGDNLHRTVKSPGWWIDTFEPDRATYDGHRQQLSLWKRIPRPLQANPATVSQSAQTAAPACPAPVPAKPTSQSTAELYQRIYDETPWYGNADEGRCPGVRLLPDYQDWLIEPVLDLGCGRGQTVEQLRKSGLNAEGIDQIRHHPGMRVGDITRPIPDLGKFNSVVCVDCIEHLDDDQVAGLFENMKQVKRQAFSIHNGESTGTGQELHVNRKDFIDWTKLIREHFEIASAIQINDEQVLYLTQTKTK